MKSSQSLVRLECYRSLEESYGFYLFIYWKPCIIVACCEYDLLPLGNKEAALGLWEGGI